MTWESLRKAMGTLGNPRGSLCRKAFGKHCENLRKASRNPSESLGKALEYIRPSKKAVGKHREASGKLQGGLYDFRTSGLEESRWEVLEKPKASLQKALENP